jgi:predicted nucleic acid-binding protein
VGKRYLIDTNAIIDLSLNRFPDNASNWIVEEINRQAKISIITKIELLGYKYVANPIMAFTKSAKVYDLNDRIVNETIYLRKEYKIKLPDAIIAATALTYNLILVTRNTSDFKKMKNLQTLNLFEL